MSVASGEVRALDVRVDALAPCVSADGSPRVVAVSRFNCGLQESGSDLYLVDVGPDVPSKPAVNREYRRKQRFARLRSGRW
jgi:hypothetical protein